MLQILSVARRLFDGLSRWLQSEFPERIVLDGLVPIPLEFTVYSRVERYRIAAYGGEREAFEFFLNLLNPNDVVYDVGASVGLYTVAAAAFLSRGTVYSFEPDPETYARLQENVRLNKLSNVHFVVWAVSDREGEVQLYTDGAAGYAPSLAQQDRPRAPTGQVRVRTCSLDIALSRNELPLPDVLKIDIEGAEALCLRGCKRLLNGEFGRPPRILFLELHPSFLPDFGSSVKEVRRLILDSGYQLCWAKIRDDQEHLCYALSQSQ